MTRRQVWMRLREPVALADAEALRAELRERRVLLTVATHMRALSVEAIRLEAARLRASAPA